jgi:hypothetical protein
MHSGEGPRAQLARYTQPHDPREDMSPLSNSRAAFLQPYGKISYRFEPHGTEPGDERLGSFITNDVRALDGRVDKTYHVRPISGVFAGAKAVRDAEYVFRLIHQASADDLLRHVTGYEMDARIA